MDDLNDRQQRRMEFVRELIVDLGLAVQGDSGLQDAETGANVDRVVIVMGAMRLMGWDWDDPQDRAWLRRNWRKMASLDPAGLVAATQRVARDKGDL